MNSHRAEYQRVGDLLSRARYLNEYTQKEVADRMGISSKTIQNWESGYSSPTIPEVIQYFKAIGANPVPYLEAYMHPELIENMKESITDDVARKMLRNAIDDMSIHEVRELLYILRGNHGSSPYAVLQEITAYLHTTLNSRYLVAEIIRVNYERELRRNELIANGHVMPDFDTFLSAIEQARKATQSDLDGYVNDK